MTSGVVAADAATFSWGARLSHAAVTVTAILFVTVNALLVGSYSSVKVAFVGLFCATAATHLVLTNRFQAYPRLILFYVVVAVLGCAMGVVGLLNPSASATGVVNSVKVYVAWSIVFVVVFTLLRSTVSLRVVHWGFVAAGILIPVLNGLVMADGFGGWGVIPAGAREAMGLTVGLTRDGVVRLDSANIAALFVIAPYLLALEVRADAGSADSWLTRLSLATTLIITFLSGRRALWLVVAMTPVMVLLLAALTGTLPSLRAVARRAIVALGLAAAVFVATAPLRIPSGDETSLVRHVRTAFSASDERNIQRDYLLDGFAASPVWGSGFGAHVEILRSDERPWLYEISYLQLLFNAGLVGVAVLGTLYAICFGQVVRRLRQHGGNAAIAFGVVIGVVSLLVGAYSNPYLGAFDNLFHVGLLPYLATFGPGFET